MADPIPSSSGSIPVQPNNGLPVDLYKWLLPQIQTEDQQNGARGPLDAWDYPDATPGGWALWNDGTVWNRMGLRPIIQRMFWAIEKLETDDLNVLTTIADLKDPDKTPAQFLPVMAKHFGFDLPDNLTEAQQRAVVRGLFEIFRARGKTLSFEVVFRLLDMNVTPYPLWKNSVLDADVYSDYSRVRYISTPVTGEVVGPAGFTNYADVVAQPALKPGTVQFTDTSETWRDVEFGVLLGSLGSTGTINYATGAFTLQKAALLPPAPGQITVSYEYVDEEFPYHAARLDLEVTLVPASAEAANKQNCNSLPDTNANVPVTPSFLQKVNSAIEEVRPVHVLVRALALVAELDEELCNVASDVQECGPTMAIDPRPDWAVDPHTSLYPVDAVEQDAYLDGLDYFKDAPGTGGTTGGVLPGTTQATIGFPVELISVCPVFDTMRIDGLVTEYW